MRHLGKWLLAMGLLATAPATTQAGLWSKSPQEIKQQNQKTANDVAGALRNAKLQGYDIGIEVKEGTAILTGEVTDAAQKDKATKVASKTRGVKKVDNRLVVSPPKAVAAKMKDAAIEENAIQQAAASGPVTNQQMAERIATALGKAGMNGFDLEVRFQDGRATVGGEVANPAQRAKITQVVSTLPGVDEVDNKVTVASNLAQRPVAPMRAPVQTVAFNQEGGPVPGPGGQMPVIPMPPIPMARSNGSQVYDMPNLPNYAWPSYAQYPNSAAVTYPKEYSASAWPYIGPFYPYPQVPLGWRAATLEWDDGHWNLNFRSRTEKWWWFLSPKNW